MNYGAKAIRWAPFAATNPEPENALPNYGKAITLGELNQLADNPVFNEARASGDNSIARYKAFFKEVGIDITILDISNEIASAITGATIETGEAKNLHFKDGDNAPYGGLVFFVSELLTDNVIKHKGIFFPKVKAIMQGHTYDTKGETVTLHSRKLRFLGLAAKSKDWKIESDHFNTEDEASAWGDQMLKTAGG